MVLEFILIAGLSLFEVVNNIDNAIINSEVLATMSEKSRKWFMLWGILIAVVMVRELLPILILWAGNSQPNVNLGLRGEAIIHRHGV